MWNQIKLTITSHKFHMEIKLFQHSNCKCLLKMLVQCCLCFRTLNKLNKFYIGRSIYGFKFEPSVISILAILLYYKIQYIIFTECNKQIQVCATLEFIGPMRNSTIMQTFPKKLDFRMNLIFSLVDTLTNIFGAQKI